MPLKPVNNESMAALIAGLQGRTTPPPETAAAVEEAFSGQARLSSVLAGQSLGRRANRPTRAAFRAGHIRAWSDLATNLANWEQASGTLDLGVRDHVLLVGWHFPELPRIFRFLRDARALLIVSQDAPWLEGLRLADSTANFQTPAGRRAIAAAIAAGRLIGAMLDHVHPGTETLAAPFLGRPTAMPSGLLASCLTNGYGVAVLGVRAGEVAVVDRFAGTAPPAANAVARIAGVFDAQIAHAPERWLMWPSLQTRRQSA